MERDPNGETVSRRFRPHQPLTDEQRAMISTPEALEVVRRVARKMSRYHDSSEIDDMIGAGYLALIRCVQNYDPASPVPFLAYCALSIRFALQTHFRELMPAGLRRRAERDTTVHMSALMAPHDGADLGYADRSPAVGSDVEYEDVIEVLARRLSRGLDRVFRLKVAGYTYPEICRSTGLPHSTVERHLAMIRRELPAILAGAICE